MSPSTRTVFTGDAHDLERASSSAAKSVRGVETAAGKADKNLSYLGNRADTTKRKLVGFGNATTLAFGAAGLAFAVKSSVDAFKDAEIQAARVAASLHTLGIETAATKKGVADHTLALQRLSGFQDDDLQKSFSTILRSTQDYNKALQYTALASDIARGSGKDLNAVSVAIAKVTDGNVAALGRYGVKAEKGASVTDVLAQAQKRYAGQAAAYGKTVAGQADVAAGEFNNLQEKIGETFAPLLNAAAGGVLHFSGAVDSLAGSVGGFGTVFSGVGGFGAVQLAVPVIGKATKGFEGLAARATKAGGGFKGFGTAVAGSIGPMGLASVGAGILAAGVYEIWKNSENADQAARGLADALTGLASAQDQAKTAGENVKLATISARKADEALAEQQKSNKSLHGQVIKDTRDEAKAISAATKAKKDHGTSSKEYNDAYRVAASAISKADGTQKAYTKGLKNTGDLAVYASVAHGRLKSAQDAVAISAGGVADQQVKVARKTTDVINKAKDLAKLGRPAPGQNAFTTPGSGQQLSVNIGATKDEAEARTFARLLDTAAGKLDKTDVAARRTEKGVAFLTRTLGRIPSTKEIKVVQRYVAQGLNLDQIKSKLDSITSKVVSVTTRESTKPFSTPPRNPINPTTVTPAAGGAFVSGRYADGDQHLVRVAGEEAILNPRHIAMVDAGVPVLEALRSTGAPTIGGRGGGFAGGGRPSGQRARDGRHGGFVRKGGKWYVETFHGLQGPLNTNDMSGSLEHLIGSGIARAQKNNLLSWWGDHYSNGIVYDDVPGHDGGAIPIKTRLSQAGLTTPGKVPPKAAARGGSSGKVDNRPAWLKRFEDSGKLDGQDSYENALARAEANLADAGRTTAKSDDIQATHALIKLSSGWLGKLHGPLRNAHHEPVWQRAVNEAISGTASSISGYQSSIKDLVRRPGPDDVDVAVPSGIKWQIEQAGFTEATGDDVTAQRRKAKWLKAQLNAKDKKGRYLLPLNSAKRIAFTRELARVNAELTTLKAGQEKEDATNAAQAATDAGVAPDLPIGIQEQLADAALTPDTGDDLAALDAQRRTLEDQIAQATDPRVRVALKGNLAGVLGSIASLKESIAGSGSPTADQSAIADQSARRLADAQRATALGEAELSALRGSGDIGTGRFGNALGAGAAPALLTILGDQRSLATLGGAMVAGVGAQASIPANRETVGLR